MLRQVAKLLGVAPAIIFALCALFVLSINALGANPADPAAWRLYMTLLPVVREPFHFLAALPGTSYGLVFLIFAAAAAAGPLLAATRRSMPRLRFAYVHAALLSVLFSMGSARVFQAGDTAFYGTASLLDWAPDFDRFPAYGYVLFALSAVSCLAWHVSMIGRLVMQVRLAEAGSARVPG